MKIALVFIAVLALVVRTTLAEDHKQLADNAFLQKQMNFLQLFHRFHQHNLFKEQSDIADNYDIEANIAHYKYPELAENFIAYYRKGMLHRGEPFSIYHDKHRKQAIMLFELFFFANDYDTFYKTACWARDHINEGVFTYSLTVAIFHREDTRDIVLPPPYELNPNMFVEDDVMELADKYWTKESGTDQHVEHVIPVNFTARNEEQLLAYFREDVDLNAFNAYRRLYLPSWFNTTRYGHKFPRRGEHFYFTYQQLYASYFLERLSHGLPEVKAFQYNRPLKTGYNPHLRYHNGEEMPARPSNMYPTDFDKYYVSDIQIYESRVTHDIDVGYFFNEHRTKFPLYEDNRGINYVGQVVEGTIDSPVHFYGALFHRLLKMVGHITDPFHKNGLAPSALEHPETQLRDPAFYQVWKRISHVVQKYKNRLPPYSHEELSFPGVKVENVDVDKLYTYFENFEFSVGNALYLGKLEDMLKSKIRVRQYRLNHKPFNVNIEVTSDKAQDVYVRVYLGPKYDYVGHECELEDRRHFFVELDHFPYHVQEGKTVITRNSQDSSVTNDHHHDSYRTLFKKVQEALNGKAQYYIDRSHNYCGYPEHLLIPKGKKGGQTFTIYVIVTPYVKHEEHESEHDKHYSFCHAGRYHDDKPLGFPFDRKIHDYDFYTSNMYFKDVLIFHKKFDEVNDASH